MRARLEGMDHNEPRGLRTSSPPVSTANPVPLPRLCLFSLTRPHNPLLFLSRKSFCLSEALSPKL